MTPFKLTSYVWLVLFAFWLFTALQSKKSVRREGIASRLTHLSLIIIAFGLLYKNWFNIPLLHWRIIPENNWYGYAGLAINIIGAGFAILARAWLGKNWSATVTLKADHQLIQTGPYAITRHPIYTGFLIALLGAAIALGELRGFVAVLAAFIAFSVKIATEEKFLSSIFTEYNQYRQKTKKLIPFVY